MCVTVRWSLRRHNAFRKMNCWSVLMRRLRLWRMYCWSSQKAIGAPRIQPKAWKKLATASALFFIVRRTFITTRDRSSIYARRWNGVVVQFDFSLIQTIYNRHLEGRERVPHFDQRASSPERLCVYLPKTKGPSPYSGAEDGTSSWTALGMTICLITFVKILQLTLFSL